MFAVDDPTFQEMTDHPVSIPTGYANVRNAIEANLESLTEELETLDQYGRTEVEEFIIVLKAILRAMEKGGVLIERSVDDGMWARMGPEEDE